MRVNHDYDRGGATAYLAAWDVLRGKVFAPLRADHRHRPRSKPWSTRS
jgi:hypothetical protein